jgi:hypothetical protein
VIKGKFFDIKPFAGWFALRCLRRGRERGASNELHFCFAPGGIAKKFF